MALLMMMCAAIPGASGTMSGAGLAVGTADALDTFLLFLLDVKTCTAKDQNYNCNNKEVLHRQNHFFSAYSAARDLLVLLIKKTITATMAATTIRPGRKPAPTEPVVISVPI